MKYLVICPIKVISVLQERIKPGADVPVCVSTCQQRFGRELLGRIISADMVKIRMCAQYPGEIFNIPTRFPYLWSNYLARICGTTSVKKHCSYCSSEIDQLERPAADFSVNYEYIFE